MRSEGATSRSIQSKRQRLKPPQWLLWPALFALAYGQSPLFTSNQNQYFLHAFARAGYGQLANDWLAGTVDPTPAFTTLGLLTLETLGPFAFYLEYGLLLAIYFISLRAILFAVFDLDSSQLGRNLTNLALLGLHAAAFRLLLGRLLGPEGAFLVEGGLAGQRLLGTVYQPSSFGVFLVASIALFLRDRPYTAVAASALAATVHPTYMLSAAALTAGYLWLLAVRDRQFRRAFAAGALALGLVIPTLITTYQVFQPTSADLARQAAEILISFRLPHHARPHEWFGPLALAKLLLIGLALAAAYRSRLRPILLVTTAIAASLSAIVLATDSPRLALLFPWRPSALLVPLSSALIAGHLLRGLANRLQGRAQWHGALLTAVVLALAAAVALTGLARTALLVRERGSDPAIGLYELVEQSLGSGQVYLVPPKLQDFRLETGAPIFVDFKSIPYRDVEVIEWEERVQLAQFFYRDDPAQISCTLLPRMHQREPITHVVLEADQFGLECPGLERLRNLGGYALFRYRPAAD